MLTRTALLNLDPPDAVGLQIPSFYIMANGQWWWELQSKITVDDQFVESCATVLWCIKYFIAFNGLQWLHSTSNLFQILRVGVDGTGEGEEVPLHAWKSLAQGCSVGCRCRGGKCCAILLDWAAFSPFTSQSLINGVSPCKLAPAWEQR